MHVINVKKLKSYSQECNMFNFEVGEEQPCKWMLFLGPATWSLGFSSWFHCLNADTFKKHAKIICRKWMDPGKSFAYILWGELTLMSSQLVGPSAGWSIHTTASRAQFIIKGLFLRALWNFTNWADIMNLRELMIEVNAGGLYWLVPCAKHPPWRNRAH